MLPLSWMKSLTMRLIFLDRIVRIVYCSCTISSH